MACSVFSRGPCHSRSRSTNTMHTYTNLPRTFDSGDYENGIWTGSFNSSNTYMYHRSATTAPATATSPTTSRWSPSHPTTPKSATSKSLTGFHVRRRYLDQGRNDLAGRRRSANADILESLGLPSMVSFQDMKSLEDGLCEDDILGHRKGHRRSSSRRVSVCLSAYNDCFRGAATVVGDNAAQVAKRVSRWTRKVTPTSLQTRRQKKQGQDDALLDEKQAQASAVPFQAPQWEAASGAQLEAEAQSLLSSPSARQRKAYSITPVNEKTL